MIRRFGRPQLIALATVVTLLGACGKKGSETGLRNGLGPKSGDSVVISNTNLVQPASGASSTIITCSVDSPSVVVARETVMLTVRASGGYAPYTLPGYGTFASQQSVSGFYDNYGSTVQIVDRIFQIYDSQGNVGTCQFRIAVRPFGSTSSGSGSGTTPSSSYCTLTPSTTQPVAGSAMNFSVAVTPSASFTLNSIQFQPNWTQSFNYTGTGSLVVNNVTYNTRGPRTVYANVNVGGTALSCNTSISVRKPKAYLVAEAGSVPGRVGSPIYLNLILEDLSPTSIPSIQLSTQDAGIGITDLGNLRYKVEALDNMAHNFSVRAVVSQLVDSSAETYIAEIPLVFAVVPPLTCELVVPSQVLTARQVSIPVRAVGVSDSIVFDVVEVGGDAFVASGSSNPILVTFATAGSRVVRARNARSVSTGAKCNGTGDVSLAVNVIAGISSCDAITSPRPALVGALVKANASVPNSSGLSLSLNISASGSLSAFFQDVKTTSSLEHMLRFRRPGSYPLNFEVTDLGTGQRTNCQTTQEVRAADTFALSGFIKGETVRAYKGRIPTEILAVGGFKPFSDVLPNFNGGIRVATGDINGDGVLDFVVGAQTGGGLRVRAIDGTNLARLYDWTAFSGTGTDAVRSYISAGDVNADGYADAIVGTGCWSAAGGRTNNSILEVYSGKDGTRLTRFNGWDGMGGVRVAAGDVNGDGHSDIVAANCYTNSLRVFSGQGITQSANLRPQILRELTLWDSLKVGAGDVNGDGYADIIAGTTDTPSDYSDLVKIYSGRPGDSYAPFFSLKPFNNQCGNNYVAATDLDGDGVSDVFVGGDGTTYGQVPELKVFGAFGYNELIGPSGAARIIPFGSSFNSSIYIGAGTGGL